MIYVYRCFSCGSEVEVERRLRDADIEPTECPSCNNPQFERVIQKVATVGPKQKGYYNSQVRPDHRKGGSIED